MLCPKCRVDMMLESRGPDGPVYVCVNPRCPDHAPREKPKPEENQP